MPRPPNFREVGRVGNATLFVSGLPEQRHAKLLVNHHDLHHIVSVQKPPEGVKAEIRTHGLKHTERHAVTAADPAVIEAIHETAEALKKGENTLVHCSNGWDRSVAVAYGALRTHGVPQEEAAKRVGLTDKLVATLFERRAEKVGGWENLHTLPGLLKNTAH